MLDVWKDVRRTEELGIDWEYIKQEKELYC